jgi:hypothetical protein
VLFFHPLGFIVVDIVVGGTIIVGIVVGIIIVGGGVGIGCHQPNKEGTR